ncbi:GNAT family N-acetyltransferase [Pseudomonas sp. RIT623]|uniref:GNAT family N-acetyltransferase n=1 Tax=Pseudomonas sp. RIT623 TaxID=2559075 RepID=UPI00106FE379|nr:GNAT family N-acetyltransferase [Pseudomonas sp. RIT623]TFF42680.1 N-acetyltransferase [Pseudomonas sp. RIT623]
MEVTAKTVRLRLIDESDAVFVVGLRTDEKYNKYLSAVGSDVEAQRQWIRNYKAEEQAGRQYYFIIERLDGVRCGTVRLYDFKAHSFSWGSWILDENKTKYAAIESAFLVYDFGFQNLKCSASHFEVMKGNEKVASFHEKMGAVQVGEDQRFLYFEIRKEAVEVSKDRFSRFLRG